MDEETDNLIFENIEENLKGKLTNKQIKTRDVENKFKETEENKISDQKISKEENTKTLDKQLST